MNFSASWCCAFKCTFSVIMHWFCFNLKQTSCEITSALAENDMNEFQTDRCTIWHQLNYEIVSSPSLSISLILWLMLCYYANFGAGCYANADSWKKKVDTTRLCTVDLSTTMQLCTFCDFYLDCVWLSFCVNKSTPSGGTHEKVSTLLEALYIHLFLFGRLMIVLLVEKERMVHQEFRSRYHRRGRELMKVERVVIS